jgi:hypothetical protein
VAGVILSGFPYVLVIVIGFYIRDENGRVARFIYQLRNPEGKTSKQSFDRKFPSSQANFKMY